MFINANVTFLLLKFKLICMCVYFVKSSMKSVCESGVSGKTFFLHKLKSQHSLSENRRRILHLASAPLDGQPTCLCALVINSHESKGCERASARVFTCARVPSINSRRRPKSCCCWCWHSISWCCGGVSWFAAKSCLICVPAMNCMCALGRFHRVGLMVAKCEKGRPRDALWPARGRARVVI